MRNKGLWRASATVLCSLAVLSSFGCKRDPAVRKQKYLESGIRYENSGKLQEANIQFANALKIDPNFATAHYELAKTLIKLGNMMVAYQELMRTVDLEPANIKARLDLGEMLLSGGVPDRALDQAKAVLALDANNADAFALRSAIEEKKGEHADALADIQHALTLDPNRAGFHATLALIESNSTPGVPNPKAEEELKKAVELDPKSATAHLMLAALMERRGDHAGAEQQDQAAIQAAPKNLEARTSLAGLYMRSGNQAGAEQVLRQAALDQDDKESAPELLRAFYIQANQLDKAVSVFTDLTASHPKSVPLQLSFARVLLQKGDYARAQTVMDKLNKEHSKSPQVENMNAILLTHEGKTADALSMLQKATKDAPDNASLQLTLAQVAAQSGDMSTAEAAFREAARLDPGNLDAQTGLAQIANHRGDSSLLAQVAENTISLHPNFASAYLWRGTAEANQNQFDQATADFQTALKKDPNNAMAYTELGQLYIKQNKLPEGKALLDQALQKDPNSIRALNFLVGYDLAAKQPAKAIERVQQQIARAPNSSALYTSLALLQLGSNDLPGAKASVQKAMQLDASNEDALQLFAQVEARSGETAQAIAVWEHWIGSHPEDARAMVMLGSLEEASGNIDKAMDDYKKTLSIVPGQPMAANNLAYLMMENGGNMDVALSLAQAARRGLPESPATADTLAWVFYHKGTYASAQDLLEGALKADPNNASIHYHLGMTYLKLNDKANAQIHLKKAVALSPNSKIGEDAQKALPLAS